MDNASDVGKYIVPPAPAKQADIVRLLLVSFILPLRSQGSRFPAIISRPPTPGATFSTPFQPLDRPTGLHRPNPKPLFPCGSCPCPDQCSPCAHTPPFLVSLQRLNRSAH